MRVIRTEYWEEKIGKWISLYETRDNLEEAKKYLSFPIVGKPATRIAEYEKTGVRKIKYNFIKEL